MGIVRVALIGLAIWLIWAFIKRVRLKKLDHLQQKHVIPPVQRMKQCRLCGVHVLESEAFKGADAFFCNKSHFDKYSSISSKKT